MTASRAEEPELTEFEKKLLKKGAGEYRGYTPGASLPEPTRGPSDPAGVSAPPRDTDTVARQSEPVDAPSDGA
ncbi:hypothetical protein ACFVW8_16085 [Streptomyces sp. NPDC058221]|uniref:hypothetical protein n=1 Tax=Streptomyces sp. NPDC058221 TaxID=3346388 RepID=UPI0036EF995F